MQIQMMNVDDLKLYDNNPRRNDEAVEKVAASIREFGFRNPILIDKDRVIIAGHTRYAAAKELGLEEVPVISCEDLTEQQVKALRLADNKTAEFSEWDFEKLDEELAGIFDIEMTDFGFDSLFEDEESPEEIPEDFKEFDDDIEVTNKCPKCGYEW